MKEQSSIFTRIHLQFYSLTIFSSLYFTIQTSTVENLKSQKILSDLQVTLEIDRQVKTPSQLKNELLL